MAVRILIAFADDSEIDTEEIPEIILVGFAVDSETDTEDIPEIILIVFAGDGEIDKLFFDYGSWTIWLSCFSTFLVLHRSLGSPVECLTSLTVTLTYSIVVSFLARQRLCWRITCISAMAMSLMP